MKHHELKKLLKIASNYPLNIHTEATIVWGELTRTPSIREALSEFLSSIIMPSTQLDMFGVH